MSDPVQLTHLLRRALDWHQAGELARAEQGYRQILAQQPEHADALHFLGLIEHQLGRHAHAVQLMRRAIEVNPAPAHYHANLGEVYRALNEPWLAESAYREALVRDPSLAEAAGNLGLLLQARGDRQAARQCYENVLRFMPESIPALSNLATLALEDDRPAESVAYLQRALALAPCMPELLGNLALAYRMIGRLDDAHQLLQSLHAAHPDFLDGRTKLGGLLLHLGYVAESIAHFQAILRQEPMNVDVWRRLITARLYLPEQDPHARLNEHTQLPAQSDISPLPAHLADRVLEKRLRVGYLSSDFRGHPVARNMRPVLEAHDSARVEIFLYADVSQPDEKTEGFKNIADHWRSVCGMSDAQIAATVRADGIDILVILAGRFDENHPLAALYRAAPIQVSMHDPATSGVPGMDYLIADANLVPRQSTELFTERVVRLPTFYVHSPLVDAPAPAGLPAANAGFVTFGSFNNLAKITIEVIDVWARILNAVRDSRLVLKYRGVLESKHAGIRLYQAFAARGIAADRVDLVGAIEPQYAHLKRYHTIDIALDTFPFTGSTTTFEALWMGVPVVTLAGETMVSRWSMAMLEKIGHPELVAYSRDDYVQIATHLADDQARLAEYRETLRDEVARSPLCDARARARQLERAYRWMWRKWCAEADPR